MSKKIFAHVPVIHDGYVRFFDNHPDAASIGVFDDTITDQFPDTRKDIRLLGSERAVAALKGLGYHASELSLTELCRELANDNQQLVLPDDEMSRRLLSEYPPQAHVELAPVFLRWDRSNTDVNTDIVPDRTIDIADRADLKALIGAVYDSAHMSSDWWRHVGAGMMIDGEIHSTHNTGVPHEHITSVEGDPRITATRGQNIEVSLFIHAESKLISQLAREGISTRGRDLVVSTFPCPNCAKLIAAAEFASVSYVEGYAMLDGQRILHDAGVEIIKIDGVDVPAEDPRSLKPYPKK